MANISSPYTFLRLIKYPKCLIISQIENCTVYTINTYPLIVLPNYFARNDRFINVINSASFTYDYRYCQALLCTCESQKSLICVLYRPPECPVSSFRSSLDFIEQYIAGADEEYQLSLFGDFNLPSIKWFNYSLMSGGSACSIESTSLLLDFVSEYLCTQHVFDPTRYNNILDLYISNAENLVSHVSTVDTPLSDHRRVEIFLSYNPCSTVSSEPPDSAVSAFRSLDFQKADFSKISGMINSVKF